MSARPRVLHICPEFPPAVGGIADYAGWLTEGLAARGFETRVLTSARSSGPGFAGATVSATVEHWDRRLWRVATREIRTYRPDVLHIQYQYVMYGGHPAIAWLPSILHARLRRPFVVVTLHDMTPPPVGPRVAGRVAFEAMLRSSDRIVVTTDASLRGVARRPGLAGRSTLASVGSNIEVHPIELSQRRAVHDSITSDPSCALLVSFGLIRRGKGLEVLISAIAEMRRRSRRVELAIVGDVGDGEVEERQAYRRELLELRGRLGLEDVVHMLGHLPESRVSAILQSCDLVVLPFLDGASAGHATVLAALTHAAPLLTTRSAGTPAAYEAAMAFVDAPPDVSGMARAIEQLIDDPGRRDELAAGAAQLGRGYSRSSIVEQIAGVYLEGVRPQAASGQSSDQAPKTPTARSRLR